MKPAASGRARDWAPPRCRTEKPRRRHIRRRQAGRSRDTDYRARIGLSRNPPFAFPPRPSGPSGTAASRVPVRPGTSPSAAQGGHRKAHGWPAAIPDARGHGRADGGAGAQSGSGTDGRAKRRGQADGAEDRAPGRGRGEARPWGRNQRLSLRVPWTREFKMSRFNITM
jgi:hypothetical protein